MVVARRARNRWCPLGHRRLEGRPRSRGRRRIAVLTPYFPYPLSHGGAVRIFNLLREMAREFDVELFSFTDGDVEAGPVLEFCTRVVLVQKPWYREPRWSTLLPPEVHEFRSAGDAACARRRAASRSGYERLQVEYTQLAEYGGDVLVEHDVTFDLFGQIRAATARWRPGGTDFRWRRFERRAAARYRHVVVDVEEGPGTAGPRREHHRHRERSGPGALSSGAGTARRASAVHRIVPPFSEYRGVPVFYGKGLAATARQISRR